MPRLRRLAPKILVVPLGICAMWTIVTTTKLMTVSPSRTELAHLMGSGGPPMPLPMPRINVNNQSSLSKSSSTRRQQMQMDGKGKISTTANKISNTTATATGMSACLLIKDENHHLIEWLAYHYHVLPLRHLIVAVDPDSKTSPLPILQRWNDAGMDLEYILWNDEDYMNSNTLKKRALRKEKALLKDQNQDQDRAPPPKNDTVTMRRRLELVDKRQAKGGKKKKKKIRKVPAGLPSVTLSLHRLRQQTFLMSCYRQNKLMNRTWVLHIDTDEFVVFNRIGDNDTANKTVAVVHDEDKDEKKKKKEEEEVKSIAPNPARRNLPLVGQNTVVDVLARAPRSPCHTMTRLLFTDAKTNKKDITGPGMRPGLSFDTNKFDTLRYIHHHRVGSNINGLAKVIVDVSQLSTTDLKNMKGDRVVKSIHRPFNAHCHWDATKPTKAAYAQSILRVNHYVGSWEDYSRRGDVRRTRKEFDTKSEYAATATSGPTSDILPWLESFVEEVGIEKAKFLLDGVGEIEQSRLPGGEVANGIELPTNSIVRVDAGSLSMGKDDVADDVDAVDSVSDEDDTDDADEEDTDDEDPDSDDVVDTASDEDA